MNYYNYMLIVQQEAMKAIVKKDLSIGYGKTEYGVFLCDPGGHSVFRIADKFFVLDPAKLKEGEQYAKFFESAAMYGVDLVLTDDVKRISPTWTLRKLHAKDDEEKVFWIDEKFLGYFKGIPKLHFGYFTARNTNFLHAKNLEGVIFGITVEVRKTGGASA